MPRNTSGTLLRINTVIEVMEALRPCIRFFDEVQREGRVVFDEQAVSAGLLIVGNIMNQAAALEPDRLEAYILHLREDGPEVCRRLIEEAPSEEGQPAVLSTTYLVANLVKAPAV